MMTLESQSDIDLSGMMFVDGYTNGQCEYYHNQHIWMQGPKAKYAYDNPVSELYLNSSPLI